MRHGDLLAAYADAALEDDREAYLSHFVFGAEMQAHYEANRQSVAGFVGPCWCRWLVLDIDRADLADALADARQMVTFLRQRYAIDDVPVWFSGSKGFHVAVELAHDPPPAVGLSARGEDVRRSARRPCRGSHRHFGIRHRPHHPDTEHPAPAHRVVQAPH